MNCYEAEPLLSALLDNELTPEERHAVQEHLRGCAFCWRTLAAYQSFSKAALAVLPARVAVPEQRRWPIPTALPRVGAAVLAGRRADADEHDLRPGDRRRQLGREREAPLPAVAADELLEPGLVDRQHVVLELRDLGDVDVDARDVVAGLRETGADDEADVAGADDGDAHRGVGRGKTVGWARGAAGGIRARRRAS